MTTERILLSFPVGGTRFNYRVAGIALRDGHVLVCREDDDDYCMLPGGRVEMSEPSNLALHREMEEELALPISVGRLLYVSESFYGREGERFHELGFMYAIELPDAVRPGGTQPFLVREDEGKLLQFSWVPLAGNDLERMRLLPPWLPQRLQQVGDRTEHVVFIEEHAEVEPQWSV